MPDVQTLSEETEPHPHSVEHHLANGSHPGDSATLDLAFEDIRRVIDEQREQGQVLTTKLNILFAVNSGSLLLCLAISKMLLVASVFSVGEIIGFLLSFSLLISAFLPRQVAVTPNLDNPKVIERYLNLSKADYQLQMIVNLVETYNVNKQRLDDQSKSLSYAACTTLGLAVLMMIHIIAIYFNPALQFGSSC